MPTTIQDIARELGLSHTTVSRVLNARDDHLISDATRHRVRQAAHKMGYQPNRVARALVSGRSYIVEFFVQHVHPAYYSRIIEALKQQLRGTPYELHIVETRDWTLDRWAIGGGTWPTDGIIVLEEPEGLKHLRQQGHVRAPLVSFGGSFLSDVDHVGVDLYQGARAAVEHLRQIGRRIAYVLPSINTTAARSDGYADAVRQGGGNPELIQTSAAPGETLRASVRRSIAEYVTVHGCPDGLFCFNDETAIGALHGLKDKGFRVPEDVALIGCDGIEDAEYQDPPLSTVAVPYEEMAGLAWKFLRRRIDQPDVPLQSAVLTPELVLRRSSDRPQ